ncbi:hypothetical protein [Spiroplasma endosymbiont of Villa modesta]|uniref:hypothetical protein n=1 Tax=Spiroplasma endosymbiont of Villa modesta TaxID=3066293 RepID=UPI00313DA1F5
MLVASVSKVGVPTSIILLLLALIPLSSFELIKLGLSLLTSHNDSPPLLLVLITLFSILIFSPAINLSCFLFNKSLVSCFV